MNVEIRIVRGDVGVPDSAAGVHGGDKGVLVNLDVGCKRVCWDVGLE